MAKSKKLAIIKQRPRNYKKSTYYWRRVRRNWRTSIASNKEELGSPKVIMNDYDYCDYKIDYEFDNSKSMFKIGDEELNKYRRK